MIETIKDCFARLEGHVAGWPVEAIQLALVILALYALVVALWGPVWLKASVLVYYVLP